MLMLDAIAAPATANNMAVERAALVKALDMGSLWQSCSTLISKALPCHSCSLLFDIDDYRPQQGRHHLAELRDDGARLVTSLEVAAPYLDAHPRIPWYTFSQIASQDAHAAERLRAQNPTPGWDEFIHMAFWDQDRLDAVLSIRIRAGHADLSAGELAFLLDLYPLLDASLQRVRALESDRVRHRSFEALLHELPIGAVFVDAGLVPSYMSQEARRICRRWSGDGDCEERLPQAIEAPLRAWMAGLDHDPGGSSASPERKAAFTVEHGQHAGRRLRLEISPALRTSTGQVNYLLVLAPDGAGEGASDADGFPRALPLLKCLTPSERKVAALVAAGLRNDMIAQRLCRSRKTIESQISSIFRKLNIANRTQLARMLS
ncbi:MAG: LuxR C-terminal-related transcriptional regulator [Proteobacteria bacterium]|nr:LuxR C-terminal-related transcriptional regulator [Pseudomonadota bacterium]